MGDIRPRPRHKVEHRGGAMGMAACANGEPGQEQCLNIAITAAQKVAAQRLGVSKAGAIETIETSPQHGNAVRWRGHGQQHDVPGKSRRLGRVG
jgi:hypothetical protein